MKTPEQIVKALKYRLAKIEEFMTQLEDKIGTDEALSNAYFAQYERHHELAVLLDYIEDKNVTTGCEPKGCGDCKTPCSAKS